MAHIPYGFVQRQDGIFVEPQQAAVVKEIWNIKTMQVMLILI